MSHKLKHLATGRFVGLVQDPSTGWEYATRTTGVGIVVIVMTTATGELVLVEQTRPPLAGRVLELPAGLAGDSIGTAEETLLDAAKRELYEETGYVSERWSILSSSVPSAGITDELHTYFHADDCWQLGPGGGDASECIETQLVKRTELPFFLQRYAVVPGQYVSSTVWAGLAMLNAKDA